MVQIIYHDVTHTDAGFRLDKWLHHSSYDISFTNLQKLCRTGQIRVNKSRVKGNYRLKKGDKIRLPLFENAGKVEKREYAYTNHEEKLIKVLFSSILLQLDDFIVLNKPSGLAVQGGTGVKTHVVKLLPGLKKLLSSTQEKKLNSLELVHRLDRDTSGILLLATSSNAAIEAALAFKNRAIHKTYLSLCDGHPKNNGKSIKMHLKEGVMGREKVMFRAAEDDPASKLAVTKYACLETNQKYSLLKMVPVTGRTHQLRVACQKLGCPIVGDKKYNPTSSTGYNYMFLHAQILHWPQKNMFVEAPIPEHFIKKARSLGLDLNSSKKAAVDS